MYVIIDFTVVPVGAGISLSPYIAACEKVLAESGLTYELHANGTNVEGEWEQVFAAIRRCHETLHSMGVARIHTDIKLGTRTDRPQTMADKIASVRERMSETSNQRRK